MSLETQAQLLGTERQRLERENHALSMELDHLRHPPLIEAKIIKVLQHQRAVVESSTGPLFIVNKSRKVNDIVQAAQHVGLNQGIFTRVEMLLLDKAELQKGTTTMPIKDTSLSHKGEKE
jgi:ATP-dependent 26S proteasome regulatory subunit